MEVAEVVEATTEGAHLGHVRQLAQLDDARVYRMDRRDVGALQLKEIHIHVPHWGSMPPHHNKTIDIFSTL